MDGSSWLPLVWAQVGANAAGGPTGTSPTTGSLLQLSLRRWASTLTLSPTSIRGGEVSEGTWAFLSAMLALTLLAVAIQGPSRAFQQITDLKGHRELFFRATRRLRLSGRLLAVVIGMTVFSWTAMQGVRYANPAGRDDLALLLANHRVVDVAWAQGTLAALTPFRDVAMLGQMTWMLLAASFVLFQFSTFRWSAVRPDPAIRDRVARWATIGWAVTGPLAAYRIVGQVAAGFSDRPLSGCMLGTEAIIVPVMMALADGVLLAWVLVELRRVHQTETRLDIVTSLLIVPSAVVACLMVFPSRYLTMALLLGSEYLPLALLGDPGFASGLRWTLSSGLIVGQTVGLVLAPVLGATAWGGRERWGTIKGWGRLLRADGGRAAAVVLLGGIAAGVGTLLAYLALLALPNSPWGLLAADSYAHYATLPVGLITLAALVDLAEGSAPLVPRPKPEAGIEEWTA